MAAGANLEDQSSRHLQTTDGGWSRFIAALNLQAAHVSGDCLFRSVSHRFPDPRLIHHSDLNLRKTYHVSRAGNDAQLKVLNLYHRNFWVVTGDRERRAPASNGAQHGTGLFA
jgi:hypothetical protein